MTERPSADADLRTWLRAPDDQWRTLLQQPALAIERRIWPLVSDLLVDDEPRLRKRALDFIMVWQQDRALPRLVEVATQHRTLFADQEVDGTRLRERLQHALANQCPPGSPVAVTLWTLVDDQLPSEAAAAPLAIANPPRAAALAARFPHATWHQAAVGAVALYRRDDLLDFLTRLASTQARETREALVTEADHMIERDDHKLRPLVIRYRLPIPRRPAPTLRDLRHAVSRL